MEAVPTLLEACAETPSVARHTSKAVRRYLEAAVAANIRGAYASDLQHFVDWGGTIPAAAAFRRREGCDPVPRAVSRMWPEYRKLAAARSSTGFAIRCALLGISQLHATVPRVCRRMC